MVSPDRQNLNQSFHPQPRVILRFSRRDATRSTQHLNTHSLRLDDTVKRSATANNCLSSAQSRVTM
jgi:hypothetical protein